MCAEFSIGPVRVAAEAPLFFIAGPCVIESEEHTLRMATELAARARQLGIPLIFKASYDKANRMSLKSFRGPGLKEGLRILSLVRERTGLPVLTDVHETTQVDAAAEVCDVLQIPAFLCRQTDLLLAVGRTGRAVNLKKGQFLAPWEVVHAVEKIASTGNERILVTERGTQFGYQNLVVDMRSLAYLRRMGFAVVFDATHSVQVPGGAGHHSGGQPEYIEPLARAAVAVGVHGVFMEVHDRPEAALSDGANALHLDRFVPLVDRLNQLAALVRQWGQHES